MTAPLEPTSERARALRQSVSGERWRHISSEAQKKTVIFDEVTAWMDERDASLPDALAELTPDIPRPTFVHWQRHVRNHDGPTWERLLDSRVPPDRKYSLKIKAVAVMARINDEDIGVEEVQRLLKKRFGDEGVVSGTWLKRMWVEAGVNRPGGGPSNAPPKEEVERFHGGAALALIAAAEVEVGAVKQLAAAIKSAAAEAVAVQESLGELMVVKDDDDRDNRGRFTAEYNARRREGVESGKPDDRWRSDAHKAQTRELAEIDTVKSKPEYLAARLMAMGSTPLLTERRGFDGLDGPAGAWLGVYGHTAYMPATLDKSLAELATLQVDGAMWAAHARLWTEISGRWRAPDENWPRTVIYVDGTADPHWTHKFALSGKVSRVGRVMPCLTRIVIHSGAGVPLLVETHAGTASLKKRLLPLLAQLDEAVGPQAAVDRLTVIDSEVGVAGMLWAMHDQTEMYFITIIKGAVLKGAKISNEGPWQPFRERDEVRDIEVVLSGKGAPAGGIVIRGVEMRRADGRNPKATVFVTNTPTDYLGPVEIPKQYLERWPRQEAQFANGRNGGGLNRSFGYGGEQVSNVALEGKLDRATRSVAFTTKRTSAAVTQLEELNVSAGDKPVKTMKKAVKQAEVAVRERKKKQAKSEKKLASLESQPKQIYQRDTSRDSVMTCLKLTMLSLIEFVMQEYFLGSGMQWRTFIEQFVALPVTVRTSKFRRIYEIHANLRQPKRMAQLEAALAKINARGLVQGKRRMEFKLIGMPEAGDIQRSG